MKWDQWVGHSDSGPVVMRIKTLFTFRGWALQLHQIVLHDKLRAYHSHPARAFRLILWNGYDEEVYTACAWARCEWECYVHSGAPGRCFETSVHRRRPGFFGWVDPDFTHRIHAVRGKVSYSLWLRGPITHKINLVGSGWH